MPKLPTRNLDAPFLGIPDACTKTGLSQCYLRAGVKSGHIPHIRCGQRILINIPALLKQLGCE